VGVVMIEYDVHPTNGSTSHRWHRILIEEIEFITSAPIACYAFKLIPYYDPNISRYCAT